MKTLYATQTGTLSPSKRRKDTIEVQRPITGTATRTVYITMAMRWLAQVLALPLHGAWHDETDIAARWGNGPYSTVVATRVDADTYDVQLVPYTDGYPDAHRDDWETLYLTVTRAELRALIDEL